MLVHALASVLLIYIGFSVEWKAEAFAPAVDVLHAKGATTWTLRPFRSLVTLSSLGLAKVRLTTNLQSGGDDEDEMGPGNMRVSEIKAELQLRGITYADCFDKESLVARLNNARASGKADPSILEKFNVRNLEQQFKEEKLEIRDEYLNVAVANDGKLPGGLTPEQFKKLTSSPKIMMLLQSTKMQEAMTLVMQGGREKLEIKMKEDPELQETVRILDEIMQTLQ